jgi:hypothetical protein
MSEETFSPQPDESSKTEQAGTDADVQAAAGTEETQASAAQAAVVSRLLLAAEQLAAASPDEQLATSNPQAAANPDQQLVASSAQAATAAAEQTASAAKIEGDISMRRSPWKSSLAAIHYVQEAAKTDHVQIRTSDRLTIIALLFFCIAEVLSLVYTPLHGFRFVFMCCCDFILGTCIVLFLVYRVGILSALNTRQALICWQMMMGCIFLGIFLCLNSIFAIAYLVETFFPHPIL